MIEILFEFFGEIVINVIGQFLLEVLMRILGGLLYLISELFRKIWAMLCWVWNWIRREPNY